MVSDYYTILGVEPTASRAVIEAALARSQPVWSSGTRNPKTKHTCQSYLDQIPTLRQALIGDLSARAAYDAELAAAHRADREAKLDKLQKLIRLRAAKGGLTVSDRRLLRDEANKLGLANDDLDRLAETIPPKPEAPSPDDSPDPPADVLDPVMRRQLQIALEHLRRRDLYDALGLLRDAPAQEIAHRAEAERQRWMKKSQVTAEKTAWLEVVTLAQSHLNTPSSRARYDRTLQQSAEDALVESIQFAVQSLPKLDPGTRALLLDEAAEAGIAPDRADRLIARACKTLGVVRDLAGATPLSPSLQATPRLLRCRSCSGVTQFSKVDQTSARAVCRHCSASLHWVCPVCKKSHWVDHPRCSCGFHLELREPLLHHLDVAQHAFRRRDYVASLAHLKRVQELASNHPGARRGVEKIKEKVAEIDRARSAFEVARAGARLVAAKAVAETWGSLVDPSSPDYRSAYTEVTRALRDAQALAAKARRLDRSDPAQARDLYRRSLAIAADLEESKAGLAQCPPDPPSELAAVFSDDRVRLWWSPPPPDGLGPVSFVILRKPEAPFKHPEDGLRIGESATPEFNDPGVISGTSVSYAVRTKRGQAESVGAVTVGPFFLLGEVHGVRVETRSREVDLSWTPPRGAAEVRVVRKRGAPPSGPADGDRIDALADQAHDRALDPDRVYHYGIFAIYRMPDGRATASHGVFVSAQPHTPVHPLDAPSMTQEPDGRITLRWIEPSRGIVKIFRTSRPLPFPPGTRLTPAQVASLEADRLVVDAPDHAQDEPPAMGLCYYTPLTSWGGSTTIGHSAVYSCVTDPSDLRAARFGVQVQMRWRWSPHGNQTLVVFRSGSPPMGPDDPSAHLETVHETDYARQGRYTLTLPPGEPGPWHVVVYALAMVNGEPVTSPGSEPTARTLVPGPHPEITVAYTLKKRRLGAPKWSITFRTEPPGSPIPPTVLVTHARTVPLSVDDGTIAAEFPAGQDAATFPLPPGLNLKLLRARIFPDPRAEPSSLPPIRLRHPEAGVVRA